MLVMANRILSNESVFDYMGHAAIFKARRDVNATIHAYPIPIMVFSNLDVPLKTVARFAARFYAGITGSRV